MDPNKELIQEENIDIREILYKFLSRWYWFVLSAILGICLSFIINRFSTPVYEIQSSILVEDEKSMLDEKFMAGLDLNNNTYKVANEIGILKSYALVSRTIRRLNFSVAYFESGKFTDEELYKQSPFTLIPDSLTACPLYTQVLIKFLSPEKFAIQFEGKDVPLYNFKYEEFLGRYKGLNVDSTGLVNHIWLNKKIGFTIVPNEKINLKNFVGKQYYVIIYDHNSLIRQFRNFEVLSNKTSSIVTLTIRGNNVSKLVDFLNTYTQVYLEKGIEKKYIKAENTTRFIDAQLGDVADSLVFSEKLLQDFRTTNKIVDVSFQAQQVFSSLENLKNERAALVLKSKYFEYLQEYLTNDNDGKNLIAPSSLGILDAALNNMLGNLIELYNERAEMILNSKRDNPYLSSNEQRIKTLKNSVLENIKTMINTSKISLQDVDRRIGEISNKENKLPEKQRKLFGYERKFKLNDALYTYLLTKRSEIQIAKASYMPDNEVIDEATVNEYKCVSPKSKRNLILGLMLGLGLPAIFILLRDYFNNKIQTIEDIEAVTDYPFLGHIMHNREKSFTVANDFPMSLTTESIRAIRTNLQFVASDHGSQVILITSSMMGEGKSFATINLALSLALYKKKTIILNFDLRKPKTQEYLDIHTETGLSSFLSGNAKVNEIINHTRFENLDAILAGVIPPNPVELIASEYTGNLFQMLKQSYDYILIDTPPVGMVSDALLLLKYSNINIFIVRHNYSYKKIFAQIMDNLVKRNIAKINIVLNDVNLNNGYLPYGYAYNYGYGYNNDASGLSGFRKIWKRLFVRLKFHEFTK
jgi:tyrosine-protein kinase Etk/Wzc